MGKKKKKERNSELSETNHLLKVTDSESPEIQG